MLVVCVLPLARMVVAVSVLVPSGLICVLVEAPLRGLVRVAVAGLATPSKNCMGGLFFGPGCPQHWESTNYEEKAWGRIRLDGDMANSGNIVKNCMGGIFFGCFSLFLTFSADTPRCQFALYSGKISLLSTSISLFPEASVGSVLNFESSEAASEPSGNRFRS